MFGFFCGLYAWIFIGGKYLPGDWVVGSSFAMIVGFIVWEEIWLMEKTHPYRYVRAVLRPVNKVLHLFVRNIETKRVYGNIYSTTLELAYPVKDPYYGKVKRYSIKHTFRFGDRFRFTHGIASYEGLDVKHGQTCQIVLYQLPEGSFDLDKSEAIPMYWLAEAPGDYNLPILKGFGVQDLGLNPDTSKIVLDYQRLLQEHAAVKKQALDWHQRAIKNEEIIEHQANELMGLLESKSDFKHAVREEVITLLELYATLENILKHYGLGKFTFTKLMALTIIAALVVAYLWANPQQLEGLQNWLNVQTNQIFLIIIIAIIGIVVYFLYRKR